MKHVLTTISALVYSLCFLQAQDTIEAKDTTTCKANKQISISLTRAWHLMGNYETVSLSYDGTVWVAIKVKGSWATNKVEAVAIRPKSNYDSVFALLKSNRLFKLEDQSKLSLKGAADDGTDYILSYKADGNCGTYSFSNPEYYKTMNPDVSDLTNYINIVEILFDSFSERNGG